MDVTSNFSFRFARASELKVETTDCLPSRRVLHRIATRMSLISEASGFSILGILVMVNRQQADLNGLAGGSAIAIIGDLGALLRSTVFLFPLISKPRLVLASQERAQV